MRPFRGQVVVLAGLAIAVLACRDDQAITDPGSTIPFSGITTTDNNGGVLSADTDDWKPLQGLQIHPAYPNPTRLIDRFTLDFRTTSTDSVRITINRSPGIVASVVLDERIAARRYLISPSVSSFSPGVYRVYVSIIRSESTLVTYGDVELLP